jgi:DNA modification methylase
MITVVNANALHIPLADGSIQTVVTSPPYYGLRSYGIGTSSGEIGLEESIDDYIENIVSVFGEVKRVLRDDGTCFLNLGDSYATQPAGNFGSGTKPGDGGAYRSGKPYSTIGSNFGNIIYRLMKGSPLIFGDAATIGITTQGSNVSLHNNGFPYRIFLSLLGIKRVTIKQRDNNFCQVLYTLADPCYCWIDCPIAFMSRNITDLEIILDTGYDVSIVISNHDANRQPIFRVLGATGARSGKSGDSTLSIEKSRKPITEVIADGQAIGDAVAFDTTLESLPDIYFVNQAVPFGDGLCPPVGNICDLRVTKATQEQFSFSACSGRVNLTAVDVTHLFFSNQFRSLIRYIELYDKAKRKSNATQAKQELGIPDLVKRALMEDGWICRSTIIWSKPNPMPESVTDRPTKSHEYLFLLSKSSRYFYDADSIHEPIKQVTIDRLSQPNFDNQKGGAKDPGNGNRSERRTLENLKERYTKQGVWSDRQEGYENWDKTGGRNKRTVWEIATQPYSGSHFATFPEKLVEPCVKAGTSERGCCPKCGRAWERIVEVGEKTYSGNGGKTSPKNHGEGWFEDMQPHHFYPKTTTGWQPACDCNASDPVPCTVLDPFAGTATVGRVCARLGRSFIGTELKFDYINLAQERTSEVQVEMQL